MRILHITSDSPATGGAKLYVRETSERLTARRHDVLDSTIMTLQRLRLFEQRMKDEAVDFDWDLL